MRAPLLPTLTALATLAAVHMPYRATMRSIAGG